MLIYLPLCLQGGIGPASLVDLQWCKVGYVLAQYHGVRKSVGDRSHNSAKWSQLVIDSGREPAKSEHCWLERGIVMMVGRYSYSLPALNSLPGRAVMGLCHRLKMSQCLPNRNPEGGITLQWGESSIGIWEENGRVIYTKTESIQMSEKCFYIKFFLQSWYVLLQSFYAEVL